MITLRRTKSFVFLGILFELLLILCFFGLPEDGFAIEVRNFAILTHLPLMRLLENLRFVNSQTTINSVLVLGLFAMGLIWSFLIFLFSSLIRKMLAQLNLSPLQQKCLISGLGLIGAGGLVILIIFTSPAAPIPFKSSPEVQAVVAGNNAFALDLYHTLESKPGNLFFSPCSICTSLALASAGARGETESEITKLLRFDRSQPNLNVAFSDLTERMSKIQRWHRITLKSAIGLWCQQNHHFTDAFSYDARETFAADARSVDFQNAPESAAQQINDWVQDKTNQKIKGLIETGQIHSNTRLVLCDALYFKGKWQHRFKMRDTQPAAFEVASNSTVTVPMMYQENRFKTSRSDDDTVQLLELPYFGGDLSMIILLPSPLPAVDGIEHNALADLEQKLTADNLHAWLTKLDEAGADETSIYLPRFATQQSVDLTPALKFLGMNLAFGNLANFSGMDGTTNLYLSNVAHKSFVEVNEEGTEAAAVTVTFAITQSAAEQFRVDHPFIFLIRDNGSGTILFLGRIIDPTK